MAAEALVTYFVTKLGEMVAAETQLQLGIEDDIKFIKHEFSVMSAFLKDADQKRYDKSAFIMEFVSQMRDESFKVEDVLDEFLFQIEILRSKKPKSFLNLKICITYVPYFFKQMKLQRQFHFQIEAIKKEINDISKRKDVYKFPDGVQSSMAQEEDAFLSSSVSTLLIEEKYAVGVMKEHVRRLEELILREEEEQQLKVISIVGMGGLGKTTLARKIYRAVTTKFQCHAWVSVTRSFEAKAILRCVLQEFCKSKTLPNDVDKMSEDSLRQQINNCLQGQSYVLVLDDIWDSKAWEVVRPALPRNTNGKVIFTSCDETVASPLRDDFLMYKLDFLPYEVARDLLCSIAFKQQNPRGKSPSWLDVFVDDMVRKCEGLPLALVTLGGFMSSPDTNPSRWIHVLDTLSYQLDTNPKLKEIKSIFLRSYNHLPPHLKCCLLYCAMFPVGSEIHRDELIRLWVAEGFVVGERQMTLEEVANTYFIELIKRNILQGIFKEESWDIQYCRMHELIHDATVQMLEKEHLGGIITQQEDIVSQANRWLAFHGEQLQGPLNLNDWNIRSLHMFVKQRRIPLIDVLFGSMPRLLRVLNLKDLEIPSLPKDFGDLIHLRHLALGKLLFSSLPSSLGKLYNLQTLYLGQDYPMPLPKEITSARQLRHLLSKTPLKMPSGVGNLSHLQTLDCVEFKGINVLKELEKLTQIRKLNIHNVEGSEDYGEELSLCIGKLKRLHELKIVCGLKERLKLSSSLSPTPPLLDTMHIDGAMYQLPEWIGSLSCLRVLSLSYCKLKEDPLKFLSQLHSLVKLTLCDASSAREMEFGDEGQTFSSLEFLELSEMYTLEELGGIQEGLMKKLRKLCIKDCQSLRTLPDGIQHLNLQELILQQMPETFIIRYGEGGADHRIVKKIHTRTFSSLIHPTEQELPLKRRPGLIRQDEGDDAVVVVDS